MSEAEKSNSNDILLDELPPLVSLEYAEANTAKPKEKAKEVKNIQQNNAQKRTDLNKDLLKKAPKTLTDKNIISLNTFHFSQKINSDRNMISVLREQLTIQGLSKNPEKDALAIAAAVGRELGPVFQNRFTTILKAGSTLECRNGILGVTDEKGNWTGTDLAEMFEAPIDESLLIGAKAKEEPKKEEPKKEEPKKEEPKKEEPKKEEPKKEEEKKQAQPSGGAGSSGGPNSGPMSGSIKESEPDPKAKKGNRPEPRQEHKERPTIEPRPPVPVPSAPKEPRTPREPRPRPPTPRPNEPRGPRG